MKKSPADDASRMVTEIEPMTRSQARKPSATRAATDATTHPFDRMREAAKDAPPALAAVAQWMLRHTAQAATLGIEDIARAYGSSPASVNRLARAAGYPGFAQLKAHLALEMRATIDPVQKLRDEQHRGNLEPSA